MLVSFDYIHRICGVIHTDIKPENVVIQIREHQLNDFVLKIKNYKYQPTSMKFIKQLKSVNTKKNLKKKA